MLDANPSAGRGGGSPRPGRSRKGVTEVGDPSPSAPPRSIAGAAQPPGTRQARHGSAGERSASPS